MAFIILLPVATVTKMANKVGLKKKIAILGQFEDFGDLFKNYISAQANTKKKKKKKKNFEYI